MFHSRTLRRTSVLAFVVLGALVSAGCEPVVTRPIVFPVDGPVTFTDTYGACRGTGCERSHEGQDLMGRKMLPLLAAVDGVVHRVSFNNLVGNSVVLKDADGWTYHYIHVNNDTPGTDDAKATRDQAFPPSIVAGAKVVKGQVVGYVGDSGNAESTAPHLHFEIREPAAAGTWTGVAINAYESLVQATRMAPVIVPDPTTTTTTP